MKGDSSPALLPPSSLPSLFTVYMLDAVLVKVGVNLRSLLGQSAEADPDAKEYANKLLPITLKLVQTYAVYIR